MNNGEYYWIRAKDGREWEIGRLRLSVDDSVFSTTTGNITGAEYFEIGPKVIGHDELIIPSRIYRASVEELRDRFAMAALTGLVAHQNQNGTASQATTDWCYAYADAMMKARSSQGSPDGESPQAYAARKCAANIATEIRGGKE